MREFRSSGSVRGVPSNGHPYRDMGWLPSVQQFSLPLVLRSSHPPVPSKFNDGDILRSIRPHKCLCSPRWVDGRP